MQGSLLNLLYSVTLPRPLSLTCNLGHMILNILIAYTATELNLRQAKQLKCSEKNYNLTAALFAIMTLLSFNALWNHIYTSRKCSEQKYLLLKWICSTGQRNNQHSYKTIFTADLFKEKKNNISHPKSTWEHKKTFFLVKTLKGNKQCTALHALSVLFSRPTAEMYMITL